MIKPNPISTIKELENVEGFPPYITTSTLSVAKQDSRLESLLLAKDVLSQEVFAVTNLNGPF